MDRLFVVESKSSGQKALIGPSFREVEYYPSKKLAKRRRNSLNLSPFYNRDWIVRSGPDKN